MDTMSQWPSSRILRQITKRGAQIREPLAVARAQQRCKITPVQNLMAIPLRNVRHVNAIHSNKRHRNVLLHTLCYPRVCRTEPKRKRW